MTVMLQLPGHLAHGPLLLRRRSGAVLLLNVLLALMLRGPAAVAMHECVPSAGSDRQCEAPAAGIGCEAMVRMMRTGHAMSVTDCHAADTRFALICLIYSSQSALVQM